MKRFTHIIIGMIAVLAIASCNKEKSLQQYLVEKQDDNAFVKLDISSGILKTEDITLSPEEQEILETVKKINVVAFPLKEENQSEFELNITELKQILKQDRYKTLVKFGSSGTEVVLKYTGEVDKIDELIVFASNSKKGFAVFRLLGDNMKPDKMVTLLKRVEKGDIDTSKLKSIGEIFDL